MYNFEEEFGLPVQKKFISLLVFDQKWANLNGLDIIKPEYFENHILHNICKWIHEYHKKYKTIPTKLVLTEKALDYVNLNTLGTKVYYQYTEALDEIFTLNDNDNLEFFKDKVIDFVRQSGWKTILAQGGEILRNKNYEEALNQFKKVLSVGSENDLGLDMSEMSTANFINLLKEDYDKSNMLQTGIPGWDRALGGGFVKKNLHLLGACFLGKTKIKTNKGKKTIEELSKLTDYSDLIIYSFDGNKKIESKVQNVFKTKETSDLIHLKFNNGKTIYCTPDHLFLIKNPAKTDKDLVWENNLAYKRADKLSEKDEL